MNPEQIRKMVIMRGTGHNMAEIADELNCSQQNVSYHLKKLRKQSLENGVDDTLLSVLDAASSHPTDVYWWMRHYKTSAKWLIHQLEVLITTEDAERLEQTKSIVKASLPAFKETYGVE